MKQYWPCAKHRTTDGELSPLFTYDSVLSLAAARQCIANWKDWYKYDIREAWVDVFENGVNIETVYINPDNVKGELTMLDKNGIEMKSGMIVKISNAYFKNDNGLYFIENSPGDPGWSGRDYSLNKISRAGVISKAKYRICFWPISVYVSDMRKTAAANDHNRKHAQIEVVTIENMSEVKTHFQKRADEAADYLTDYERRWPEDRETIGRYQAMKLHYQTVANGI